MESIKKMKMDHVVRALVMIAVGIVLIVWTKASLIILARALAVLLILVGLIFVLTYIFKKERKTLDSGQLAVGILVAAVGVWIFINPTTFTDFIPKLFGVFIILSGLMNLGQTVSLIKYQYGLWWLSLILGLITLALGGYLLFNPAGANQIAIRVIGCFLAYDGASNLWTISRVTKYAKKFEQGVRDAQAVDVDATIVDADQSQK